MKKWTTKQRDEAIRIAGEVAEIANELDLAGGDTPKPVEVAWEIWKLVRQQTKEPT